MTLRYSSAAKPVRIRVKSGGEEHSTLDSLCNNFSIPDILELLADHRLERWLERQPSHNDSNVKNFIKPVNEIVQSINAYRERYQKFLDDENNYKQLCYRKDAQIELIQCFFSTGSIKSVGDVIRWFKDCEFANNVCLFINEDQLKTDVKWTIWTYRNADELGYSPSKGWIEILKSHSDCNEVQWLLYKEYKRMGDPILAMKSARAAFDNGYDEDDFMANLLNSQNFSKAKEELNGESDGDIIIAYITVRDVPITKENLLSDYGYAKYQIKYSSNIFPTSIDKVAIMDSYGVEGLLWLGRLLEQNDVEQSIECYKRASKLGDNEASEKVKILTGDFSIPFNVIKPFLIDPTQIPDLTKYIINKEVRDDVTTLFELARDILKHDEYGTDKKNPKSSYEMYKIVKNVTNRKKYYSKHKWISVEIDFIKGLGDWFGWNNCDQAFKSLYDREYKPAWDIYINKNNYSYNNYFSSQNNPYFKSFMTESELETILNAKSPWKGKYLYEMIVYFMANFVQYRKNQYQNV